MTIHASKGLQFPVVIGVCGFKGPFTQGKVYTYHKKDKNTGTEKQMIAFKRNEIYKEEEIAEWKRLYYVAYTRAQFLMIMPYYQKYGQDFLSNSMSSFVNEHESNIRIIEDNKMQVGYNEEEIRVFVPKELRKLFMCLECEPCDYKSALKEYFYQQYNGRNF